MEFVGIFLLLAPLGALVLYLRRSAQIAAREAAPAAVAEPGLAAVFEETAPEAKPAPESEAEAVEEDPPRRMQV